MSKIHYDGSEQFRPISAWGYIGYSLLFAIPVVGFILLIVFALSESNVNRRNYARSYFCALLVVIVLTTVMFLLGSRNIGGVGTTLKNWFPQFSISENRESVSSGSVRSLPKSTARPTAAPASGSSTAGSASASKASGTAAGGIRKNVKEAIDEYEAFFNEYAAFMKKYASSSNSLSMLEDYTSMLTKYVSYAEKWDRFEEDYDLNDAEVLYFTEASLRIEKALLGVI